jgi:hypothetical protein
MLSKVFLLVLSLQAIYPDIEIWVLCTNVALIITTNSKDSEAILLFLWEGSRVLVFYFFSFHGVIHIIWSHETTSASILFNWSFWSCLDLHYHRCPICWQDPWTPPHYKQIVPIVKLNLWYKKVIYIECPVRNDEYIFQILFTLSTKGISDLVHCSHATGTWCRVKCWTSLKSLQSSVSCMGHRVLAWF